eukprot:1159708-Pelagomonas_calceolata.AAC.10
MEIDSLRNRLAAASAELGRDFKKRQFLACGKRVSIGLLEQGLLLIDPPDKGPPDINCCCFGAQACRELMMRYFDDGELRLGGSLVVERGSHQIRHVHPNCHLSSSSPVNSAQEVRDVEKKD